MVILGFGLSHLKIELDIYDVFDPSLKSSTAQWMMRDEYGDTNSIFISLSSDKDITLGQACDLKNYVSKYVNTNADVSKIISPWGLRRPRTDPDGSIWYYTYLNDPCLEEPSLLIKNQWQNLDQTPWKFFFQGKSKNQLSFEVVFKDVKQKNGKKKFDVASIDKIVNSLKAYTSKAGPDLQMYVFGQVSIRWYIMEIMKKDSVWNAAMMVLFLLFFYAFLGTWRAGFYYGISLFFTEIFIFGIMGLIGYPVDIMSNCLFMMTAVAGISDFLFISSSQKAGEGWKKSFIEVATPSFFTSVTTILGFLSLSLSEIPAISRFGIAAGFGALFQWTSTYLIFPALLEVFKVKNGWVRSHPRQLLNAKWFTYINRIYPGKVLTSILVTLSIVSAFTFSKLNIGEDILTNFPESHPLRQAYSWLDKDKGWQGQVFLLFLPEVSDIESQEIIKKIKAQDVIAHVENPIELENFLAEEFKDSKRDMVLREMSNTTLKRYRSKGEYLRVPLYTNTLDVKQLQLFTTNVAETCGDKCFLAGQTMVYLEYSDRISKSLIESLFVSAITVGLLLLLLTWLQGSTAYLSLALSAIWGPLVMMGFLWVTQLPVTSMTSIFFALIVGWTGDNGIQYLFANKSILEGAEMRASATLMQTLIFCGCSVFLMVQTLTPMRILGVLFFIGFIATYIGDLWILKGLLNFKRGPASKSKKV